MDENEFKICPFCAETIKKEAKICRFCRMDLSTGKSIEKVEIATPVEKTTQEPTPVRAKSGVGDGVKMGCGMFIVLPIIIITALFLLLLILGSL